MEPDKMQRIYNILQHAQIEYDLKRKVYELICEEKNKVRLLGKLQQMKLERNLEGAIVEQIVANI